MISLAKLTTDRRLLGPVFGAASYRPMLAILKAALAEPLDDADDALFRRLCGDRGLPAAQVRELVIAAGRGAGKTQAAALATIALSVCRRWRVSPGQVPVALLMAADQPQARVAFRFVRGLLD